MKQLSEKAIQIFKEEIEPKLPEFYFPPKEKTFLAFDIDDPKVVILGQDPYHNGLATGYAFDVPLHAKVPPSLRNIIDEVVDDMGFMEVPKENETYLDHWTRQGVMLINTALTVESKEPGGHAKLWQPFTEEVITSMNSKDDIIWILWGNHAKSYKKFITNKTHHVIEGFHPSPFSARHFKGGKYFSKANEILETLNKTKIKW